MSHSPEDGWIAQPQVFTLHWEGPPTVVTAEEPGFPGSRDEERSRAAEEREDDLRELSRGKRGRALWDQIRAEASTRGDEDLWRRKLHAYWWVKLVARGHAGEYARRHELNHATVRTWISDVARLAYEVGYRLHEDKLLLTGSAPPELQCLRELVRAEAESERAWSELQRLDASYRGVEPYFHLNEGHILRARARLAASDATLRDGLTIAEARPVRALLWNARGQTFWDCLPSSTWPLADHLERAERCFRRAALLDPSTYFPYVNLAQLAADEGDHRRVEYWVGELATARKRMDDEMKEGLAEYLGEAEWVRPVEEKRFWRNGPRRWLEEVRRAATHAVLLLALALPAGLSAQAVDVSEGPDVVAHGKGTSGGKRGGAGGN
jgi:hypothetical protein